MVSRPGGGWIPHCPLCPHNNLLSSQIASDRASESYFQSSRAKCQCDKAKEIIAKCEELGKILEQVVQKEKSNNKAEFRRTLKTTEEEVREVGASLRSNISIQVRLN